MKHPPVLTCSPGGTSQPSALRKLLSRALPLLGAAGLVMSGGPGQAQVSLGSGATMEVLGTGTESLLGGDLTDPENDGDELAGESDPSWNWKSISSNNEPGFEGGEFSYNVFDNTLAAGNGKWCCPTIPTCTAK